MRRSSKETDESAGLVTRRGLILGGGQIAFMGLLGLRMRQMQVEEAEQYRLLAEENRINVRLIPPSRGIIYDRHGVAVAHVTGLLLVNGLAFKSAMLLVGEARAAGGPSAP